MAYNIDYSTFVTDDNIPDSMCNVMNWSDHIGCCHDPKVIEQTKLSKIIDSKREKIKQLNEKKKITSKLNKQTIDNQIKAIREEIRLLVKERSNIMKTKPKFPMCAGRKYRFLKEPKGVLPTILQNLLDARKNTRAEIKIHNSEIQALKDSGNASPEDIKDLEDLNNVLDKRQLAYKISSNSMYGAMGVRQGYLPFMPGAMCVTYMGRTNIDKVAEIIPNKYGGELIYGDTDSNYINFPHLHTAEETWEYAEHVANEVSKNFPKPIKLEFEDVIYWSFMILTKKRYMYKSCGKDGKVSDKIGKKGVLLARRDNSKFIRDVYEQIIMMVFNKADLDDILYYIIQEINKMCSNSRVHSDFVITKSVGDINNMAAKIFTNNKGKVMAKIGDYSVPAFADDDQAESERQMKLKNAYDRKSYYVKCLPAHVQLAEKMRRRGQRVDPGTRLEHVIVDIGNIKGKQYEKLESADYFMAHRRVLRIDFMYYLGLLAKPVDQVLNIIYSGKTNSTGHEFKSDFVLSQYNYRLNIRKNVLEEIQNLSSPEFKLY
jgi:DNA polymerase elongation subunit (family B)